MKRLTLLASMLLICIVAFGSIASAQLLNEDFNFTGNLTANGWSAHSAGGTNPIATTTGLTYAGYKDSGIGNAALVGNTGEDDNLALLDSVYTNGKSVFVSFMVSVTDTATERTGDYFFHLGNRANATTFTSFAGRVFARIVSGNVNFGISNLSAAGTVKYSATSYAKNTSYLVVLRYLLNTSGVDTVKMWVKASGVPATEPGAGAPDAIADTSGLDVIDALALRQGTAANSVSVVVDGIRVDTTWAGILSNVVTNPVYSVGTGNVPGEQGHFTSLKAAFDTLSRGFVFSGNSTFYITSDITEPNTGGIGIGLACDPTPYTVTFKPYTGIAPTITLQYPSDGNSGPSGACLIGLNGAANAWADLKTTRNIVFDGSNTNGGTTRDLTIQTTGSTRNALPIVIVGDASGITVKNCNIYYKVSPAASTSGNLLVSAVMIRTATAANTGTVEKIPSNITFDNNNISSNFSGAVQNAQGLGGYASAATTGLPSNIIIRNNKIEGKRRGISLYLLGSTDIYNNEVVLNQSVADGLTNEAIYGISTGATSTYKIYNNRISTIASINSTGTTTGIAGISLEGDGTFNVYNNMIYGFALNSVNANKSAYAYGIKNSSATATANIFFNTIQMDNLAAIGTGTVNYRGMYFPNGTNSVKNNIVVNNEDDFACFDIFRPSSGAPGTFSGTLTSDYNDFYRSGTTNAKIGFYDAADAADLAAWKSASGQDANSVSGAAQFVSATDLHINPTASPVSAASNAGTPIGSVTTDIDGDIRDAIRPDIGADEFVASTLGLPTVGDYGSFGTGNWGVAATWRQWDGSGWNTVPAAVPRDTSNVYILSGHTVSLEGSGKLCKNLTIQPGATLKGDSTGLPAANIRYVRVYGTSVRTDGTFGGDSSNLAIEWFGNVTFTGTGKLIPHRMRTGSNVKNIVVTIDQDMKLTYGGASGTGGAALYTSNSGNDSITVTLNAGRTLTVVDNGYVGTNSSTAADAAMKSTFNINGTLIMQGPNNTLFLRTSSPGLTTLNVGGTCSVSKNFYPTGTTGLVGVVNISAGGTLTVGTSGSNGLCDFATPTQVVTGGGKFELASGTQMTIGAAAGLDPANGPIRTTTRAFSTGGRYSFVGAAAQVTGSDLPSTVNRLTINNTNGVTLTGNVVVDTLAFTAGRLITGSKSVTVTGAISSAGSGKFVEGNLILPVAAAGTKKWEVGQASDYLPMTVFFKSVTGSGNVTSSVLDRTVTPPAGQIQDTTKVLKRYYRVTKTSGITAFDTDSLMLCYVHADAIARGLREDTLKVYKFDGSQWSKVTVKSIDTTANVITVTGVNSFSDFMITGAEIRSGGIMTIRDARAVPNGTEVTFQGVATRVKGNYTYMQDTTGGMVMYQSSGAWKDSVVSGGIKPGDIIRVQGKTSEFNSLKEVVAADLVSFTVVSRNNPLPAPQVVTLKQLSTNGEDYEGELVKVLSVSIVAGADTSFVAARTYQITDPSDSSKTVSLRIPNATDGDVDGLKIPKVATFTGPVGQFSSTGTGGYQLMAINATDILDNALAVKDIYSGVPQSYELHNNYPNPFNPSTTILYGVPQESRVTVKIYSILGQEVNTLVSDLQSPSYYRMTWNGTNDKGSQVGSGVYFCRMVAEPVQGNAKPFVQVIRMLLMK